MDPLSEVLSLLKLKSYVSGGFAVDANRGFDFPRYQGIKCYAVSSGSCRLSVQGGPDAVLMTAGDCVLQPRGLPFCLATDLSLPRVNFSPEIAVRKAGVEVLNGEGGLLHPGWALRPYGGTFRNPVEFVACDRAHPQAIGQRDDALVTGPHEKGIARASAGRIIDRPATGVHDSRASSSAASAGRSRQGRRLAFRPGGSADENSDQMHA